MFADPEDVDVVTVADVDAVAVPVPEAAASFWASKPPKTVGGVTAVGTDAAADLYLWSAVSFELTCAGAPAVREGHRRGEGVDWKEE